MQPLNLSAPAFSSAGPFEAAVDVHSPFIVGGDSGSTLARVAPWIAVAVAAVVIWRLR